MTQVIRKLEAQGRPAKMLSALAASGPTGLSAKEYQRTGIALCGNKSRQMQTAESLQTKGFVERRVILTPLGLAEATRLASERKAAEDSAFHKGRTNG